MITPQQIDPLAGSPSYDSTAAIAGAIAVCPSGGEVQIPATASGYLISGGFTITQPISIIGEGDGSFLDGALPAGVDLFHIVSAVGQCPRGFNFMNFRAYLSAGGNLFHLDTTAGSCEIADVLVSGILGTAAPGSHCVFLNNGGNASGGTFNAEFERNVLVVNGASAGCYWFQGGGDSLHIRGGIQTGTGYGLYSDQVAGAGNLVVEDFNMTASGGLVIARGVKPIIRTFEIEFAMKPMTGAGINFGGLVGLIDGGTIGPGQVQVLAGGGPFGETIYINDACDVDIAGVRLSSGTGQGIGINITATAARTRVAPSNTYSGFATNVANASSTTVMAA